MSAPTLRPATSTTGACVLCLGTVAVAERGAHAQEHRDPRGAVVRLLWHGACAERCGWLARVADNESAPAACPVAAARFEALHRELCARLRAQGGAAALRAVVHVARDLPGPLTLRGPGEAWGLPTTRIGGAR